VTNPPQTLNKTIYKHGNVRLRHRDLLNYQTDLQKTDIFRSWWFGFHGSLFLFY